MKKDLLDLEYLCASLHQLPPGERLRQIRETVGGSQKVLADACGVPQSTISRMEKGADALLSTWIRVLSGLGGDVRFFVTDEEQVADVQADAFWRKCRRDEGLSTKWRR